MSKSLLSDEKECYLCGRTDHLHKHHIFYGSNRPMSDREGCWVWLCQEHHVFGDDAVHKNRALDIMLKQKCQKAWMHRQFIQVFGKSYLDEEEEDIWQ